MVKGLVKELYPFKSHYLDLNGLQYHYLDEGQGEPVAMLHGNPTWSFYYRNLVKALRDSYRTIVPDHIGCGLSDKPDDSCYDYTLARRVEDLTILLDKLNIKENISLVLHDWGGMIGMVYAVRHPERIKRLIILNTSAFHLPKTKTFPWPLWATRTWLGALSVRTLNSFGRTATHVCCRRRPMSKELREAYLAPYGTWADRIALLRFVQDIPLKPGDRSYDLVSEVENGLSRLSQVPMMICWGEKDFIFDHHFLDMWIQNFPHAELHKFGDSGHYVLEDAGEDIIPLAKDFLQRHPLGEATHG